MTELQKTLFDMADPEYKEFHQRLMPTVDPDTVIGVRTPVLRTFAKKFSKTPEASDFLAALPHKYYEENNLHAFVIEPTRGFAEAAALTENFLPYIDNWATCDMFLPREFKKHPQELLPYIKRWISSSKPYTVRFAIGLLMKLYLDENYKPEYLEAVAAVRSDEYYVKMMAAWYFATALAKRYDDAVKYISGHRLDPQTHKMAVRKACESNRISREVKAELRAIPEE